jgi:hypothetical protein
MPDQISRTLANRAVQPTEKQGPSKFEESVRSSGCCRTLIQVPAADTPQAVARSFGELFDAITSQMGLPDLPSEQRQNLIARLVEDPVIKALIR